MNHINTPGLGTILAAAVLAMPPVLHAAAPNATPPDAGSLLREQRQQRQLPRQLMQPGEEESVTPTSPASAMVMIKDFTFSGHEGLVTEEELRQLVEKAIGTSMSLADLQALVDTITTHLRDKGWILARAYLPEQDVTSGLIAITIIPGKSDGSLRIEKATTVRIGSLRLERMGEQAVRPGEPVDGRDLERILSLMNDLPGINARMLLSPGTAPGTVAVKAVVNEGPIFSGGLWGDNHGNSYTGAGRGNALLTANDPFGWGDRLSLLATLTDGLNQGGFTYALPIGYSGLSGDVTYTGMNYKLGKEFAALDYTGDSQTIEAGLSYPWLRSRTASTIFRLNYGYANLHDEQAGIEYHDKKVNRLSLGAHGDWNDNVFDGGRSTWTIEATGGNFAEDNALTAEDAVFNGTDGGFVRFNLGLSRLQRLTKRLNLSLAWSGQLANDNLDSSEKLYLGGPYGVRAYPVGEGPANSGHLLNADLIYTLPLPTTWGTLQLDGFYDAGQITLYADSYPGDINTATGDNSYWLQGAGLGLNYSYESLFALRTAWAHTIGSNAGRDLQNNDADGKSDDNRFWLQAILYL
jgi:hemolysin activation/secretion protein